MTMKQKALIGGAVVVLVLALGALWFWGAKPATAPVVDETPTATTTDETQGTTPVTTKPSTSNGLPVEPAFVLPDGATALDDYAYVLADQVYFRSITNKAPLAIPNSDAETFAKLSDFTVFPGDKIVSDCGASGTYGYYGDKKQVYFYQFWRSPQFRSSTIEVIVGVAPTDFKVTGATTATDDGQILKVSYEKATSTCKFILSKVDFVPSGN